MKCEKCGESKYLQLDVAHGLVMCRRAGCGESWKVDRLTGERVEGPTPERLTQIQVRVVPAMVREIDEQKGVLHRSQWFVQAVQEKLARDRLNA